MTTNFSTEKFLWCTAHMYQTNSHFRMFLGGNETTGYGRGKPGRARVQTLLGKVKSGPGRKEIGEAGRKKYQN